MTKYMAVSNLSEEGFILALSLIGNIVHHGREGPGLGAGAAGNTVPAVRKQTANRKCDQALKPQDSHLVICFFPYVFSPSKGFTTFQNQTVI